MTGQNLHINDDLLVKFILGETLPEEFDFVADWLNQSEENQKQLDDLELVWLETGKLKFKPVAVDVDKAWNKVSDKIEVFEIDQERNSRNIQIQKKAALFTAALAAMLVVGFTVFSLISNNFGKQIAVANQKQPLQKYLSDGSIVTINQNSKLTYPKKFKGATRLVKLEGEAFFKIEPNAQKPFIIDAGIGQIKVVGTQFDVKINTNGSVEVTVIEGKVELASKDALTHDSLRIQLTAGDKGIIDALQNKPALVSNTEPDNLFWMNKTLIFNDTRLYRVFEILEYRFDIQIVVANPKIYECPLTSTFINNSPDEILEIIAYTFNLDLKKDKNQYLFDGEDCSRK